MRRQMAKCKKNRFYFLCQSQIKKFLSNMSNLSLVYWYDRNELEQNFSNMYIYEEQVVRKIMKKKKLQMALFNEKNINKSKWTNKCNCYDKEAPKKTAINSFLMIKRRCSSTSLWIIHSIFINTLNGSNIQSDRELEYEIK